jgi:hypothetical protein
MIQTVTAHQIPQTPQSTGRPHLHQLELVPHEHPDGRRPDMPRHVCDDGPFILRPANAAPYRADGFGSNGTYPEAVPFGSSSDRR